MSEECCCQPTGNCNGRSHGRQFLTKEEKIKHLETYAEELKKEIVAVDERIKELRS
jgi:hypothetical protein